MKFTDMLTLYGVNFKQHLEHHHVSKGWIGIDCPFCSRNTNRFRMGYNLAKRYVTCWSCGSKSLLETTMLLTNLPANKAYEIIGGLDFQKLKEQTINAKLELPTGIGDLLPAHRKYLKQRNFDIESIVSLWGIQGIGLHKNLSWRLFIPIHRNSRVVSWTTRSISNSSRMRYITAQKHQELIPCKHLLYGEDYAGHTIIIVEGPTDVWRIGPGAVATLGVSYSKKQLLSMSKYPRRVVCFDKEKNAQKRAKQLINYLSCFDGDNYNVVLDSSDPGSATDFEINELRKQFLND